MLNRFAYIQNDTTDERFSKNLILIVSICCSICGLMWGAMYYWFLDFGLTSALPWLFTIIVGLAIPVAHAFRNHLILVYTQLICITWITALIQWSLGSLHDSGIVISWSFLGPIGALLFLNKKQAIFWFVQFLAVVMISIIIEPKLSNDSTNATDTFRNTFYLMNLCVPAFVVFWASLYFVNDILAKKNLNFSLLKLTEEKNQEILDSIKYAKRIQSAILPPDQLIKDQLPNSFILYKPKDIVAGDFYWLEKTEKGVLFAAADCTGHGVPGAMVSVICNGGLNRSVREFGLNDPGQILDNTRELVIQEFEKSEEEVKDGMDIALCKIEATVLSYAGANNPLWVVRNGEVLETKANKQPIGKFDNPAPYTTHSMQLEKGDSIYLFSDGFVDQFGGEKGKKFKPSNLRKLLISIQNQSMEHQKTLLDEAFEDWRGTMEQIDDVCVVGVRV